MLTLGYARLHLAPFCGDGVCANDNKGPNGYNRATLRIQEAVAALMAKPGCPRITKCMRVCMSNGCVTAPRDVEKFIKARINGEMANVFDRWYEFLEGGPGMVESDRSGFHDLIDRGTTCTQYDLPEPMRLAVCSDLGETDQTWLHVQGWDETDREVRSNTPDGIILGEYVPVTKDVLFYTQATFSKIKCVVKPRTNGYVMLAGVDFDAVTGSVDHRHHLAFYHPDDERPEFRRYAFQNPTSCGCHHDKYYTLNAVAQMKFVPFWRDTDVIWIDDIQMIKRMLQAMKYYDGGDPEKGKAYETLAENKLLELAAKYETVQAIPDIQVTGWNDACPVTP